VMVYTPDIERTFPANPLPDDPLIRMKYQSGKFNFPETWVECDAADGYIDSIKYSGYYQLDTGHKLPDWDGVVIFSAPCKQVVLRIEDFYLGATLGITLKSKSGKEAVCEDVWDLIADIPFPIGQRYPVSSLRRVNVRVPGTEFILCKCSSSSSFLDEDESTQTRLTESDVCWSVLLTKKNLNGKISMLT